MLKLILTRHAKSSWDNPLLYDHDRPLNGRGVKSAKAIGGWLKETGNLPEMVLTSSATRAQMTAELIAEALEFKGEFKLESGLYHASPETMLKHLRRIDARAVLMVGHNPGIADFAERIVAQAPDHARFFDYPTAATLIASTTAESWREVGFGKVHAQDFMIPRELLEPQNPA